MRRIAAIVSLFFALAALVGCASRPPSGAPSIQGVVTNVSGSGDGRTILVVWGPGLGLKEYELDAVSARVSGETGVEGVADASAIMPGAVVDVWLTGPLAESYPPQGSASYVRVLRRVPTDRLPEPRGLRPPPPS